MTPASLRALMIAAGWSAAKLAELLDVNEGTVRDWLKGRRAMPDALIGWFMAVAEFYKDCPPPLAVAFERMTQG